MGKIRLDQLLLDRHMTETRTKAQQLIMAGEVFVNGERVDKSGTAVDAAAEIEVRGDSCPYVSRGGLKLARAVSEFGLDLNGLVCMDIGASTGGFTDCMLQNGAARVYSIDVGYGQLAWTLRNDPRVINLERTNVRNLTKAEVPEKTGFISIDVSFISLRLVLPVAGRFLEDGGTIVALVKPQFEAGREKVGKNGVIRDEKIHLEVLNGILDFCAGAGFDVTGLTWSPVKGPKGNIEFLLKIGGSRFPFDASTAVEAAHQTLDGERT